MISLNTAQEIHNALIARFGGSPGVRDVGALESALSRPFQMFENSPLYPAAFQKAAALLESIVVNHPFVDGNKRSGYVLTRLFLIANNYDLSASEDEKYRFVMSIASGKMTIEEITQWLKTHSVGQGEH